jgi:hypothetical protein
MGLSMVVLPLDLVGEPGSALSFPQPATLEVTEGPVVVESPCDKLFRTLELRAGEE